MLSILDVHPKMTGTPTEPLRRAVEKLKETAELEAQREAQENRFRNRYYQAINLAPRPISVELFEEAVMSKITSNYGKKGPTENAANYLHSFSLRAFSAGYPLNSSKLQSAFMNFLMAYVTEGFVGEDANGTQMGGFLGKWTGGGF